MNADQFAQDLDDPTRLDASGQVDHQALTGKIINYCASIKLAQPVAETPPSLPSICLAWFRRNVCRPAQGLAGRPEMPAVLRAMLVDFARKARDSGEVPIVILIEDQGYGSTLSAMISPTDPASFISDGHFTPSANGKLAHVMLDILYSAVRQ